MKLSKRSIALNTLNNQDTDVYNDIKVTLFAGINIGTLDNLYVNENGVPVYNLINGGSGVVSDNTGDGTVPLVSMHFPRLVAYGDVYFANSSHAELPGKVISDLFTFITSNNQD